MTVRHREAREANQRRSRSITANRGGNSSLYIVSATCRTILHNKQRGHPTREMGKRGRSALHGAMNTMWSLLLCLTFGRLLLVILCGAGFANPVPTWLPAPQQQPRKDHHFPQQDEHQHRPAASQRTAAYAAGRRGEAMPAEMGSFRAICGRAASEIYNMPSEIN